MAKRLAPLGWGLSRVGKLPGNIFSALVRLFVRVKERRVMCWAYNFKQYSCNPRSLTDYLLANREGEFEIWWVVRRGVDCSEIDPRVRVVRFRSWRYFLLVNSAGFLISNVRTDPWHIYWHKRPTQRYMMLWHAGMALKRIEQDAEQSLSYSYLRKAHADSAVCDLMISGCRFQSELIASKFWYDGEILEKGVPRNDIFFRDELHAKLRRAIGERYGISAEERIVIYAPTFRSNYSLEPYRLDWRRVIPELERTLGGPVRLLLRLHPLLIGNREVESLLVDERMIDVTRYHDMQELLVVSDLLITDYSSSMFDFAMLRRPCLLYAPDAESYDRGYYFRLEELPFPMAHTEEELVGLVAKFDKESYAEQLNHFFAERVGLFECGKGSEALADWMAEKEAKI